jgi:uncharacterized membrane protein YkvI
MSANARTWGAIIAVVAIILIVLSLMVLTQQIQNAPVPTPSGVIPTITIEPGSTSAAPATTAES